MNGAELIAAERERQVDVEGWSALHDDQEHASSFDLARAGACYAWDIVNPFGSHAAPSTQWPWDDSSWKPTPADPVRQLVKAGALIAAEIDRLLREATLDTGRRQTG